MRGVSSRLSSEARERTERSENSSRQRRKKSRAKRPSSEAREKTFRAKREERSRAKREKKTELARSDTPDRACEGLISFFARVSEMFFRPSLRRSNSAFFVRVFAPAKEKRARESASSPSPDRAFSEGLNSFSFESRVLIVGILFFLFILSFFFHRISLSLVLSLD